MNYVNLCPHPIVIVGAEGETLRIIAPSGAVARCTEETEYLPVPEGGDCIPTILRGYGHVNGLPEPAEDGGTVYIVSNMVRLAEPERMDIASPGDAARDLDPCVA